MTTQNSPVIYAKAIQYQLKNIFNPIPVYANFNRNFATEPSFVVWVLRNVHQDVYTGTTKSVKGIDRPIVQITIFSQDMVTAFSAADTLLQQLHGYSGHFGSPSEGFYLTKADVQWAYNTYDNTVGLHQIVLDCQLDIPA
jgi:hypothetical protein